MEGRSELSWARDMIKVYFTEILNKNGYRGHISTEVLIDSLREVRNED